MKTIKKKLCKFKKVVSNAKMTIRCTKLQTAAEMFMFELYLLILKVYQLILF